MEPTLDGDTKVFELTVDKIQHRIDGLKDPIAALGYNGTWPGPRMTVVEGDKVRAIFKNNLDGRAVTHGPTLRRSSGGRERPCGSGANR